MLIDKFLIVMTVIIKPQSQADEQARHNNHIFFLVTAQGGYDCHFFYTPLFFVKISPKANPQF
jgi:hypothetical protein